MEKKTDAIKEHLQAYADMRRDHENQLERLDRLRASAEYKSPSFESMPGGGGGEKDKMTNYVAEVIELEKEIGSALQIMEQERKELDHLIRKIQKADERAVIRMKYFDGMGWTDITHVLFHREDDYKQAGRQYQQRTYKLHGSALVSLAKIYNAELSKKRKN
ncbi:MAG: DUF1492 domain-containing protein [Stomatobaculum sp.]